MKFFYFSSTHWDREWYQSFQGFRKRLVEVARGMCDSLESDPAFDTFHFDGQTVVLEDIAEIEPDTERRLRKLIGERRILIGPWYVMPDEFLVSGEAMINNLRVGHDICADYGTESWKFGYICDIFGHIAQMPQILSGFGIRYALLGRGTNESTTDPFFRWRALDGTEATVVRIADYYGYGDFNMRVFGFDDNDIDEESFRAKAREYLDAKIENHIVPVAVLMDGIDHAPIHSRTPEFLSWLREMYPDDEFFHTDLVEAGNAIDEYRENLYVKNGELIEPAEAQAPFLHLITNTLSSYYPLKRWNDECQAKLERVVAPLLVERNRRDDADLSSFVDSAWRYLLKNHPHDSIGGCSIDQVHRDMEYRFSQCSLLVSEVIDDELNRLEERLDDDQRRMKQIAEAALAPSADYAHQVYNPLPFPRDEAIDVTLELPEGYSTRYAEPFGYQSLPSFLLYDENGNELPYRIVEHTRSRVKRVFNQVTRDVEVVTVNVRVPLKPMSWTRIRVAPCDRPVRCFGTLGTAMHAAQTDALGFTIESDGTITLEDRVNRRRFPGMNRFVVDAEIGDGWYHAAPVNDTKRYTSVGTLTGIALLRDTPHETRYRITHVLEVPSRIEWLGTLGEQYGGIAPSEHATTITIHSEIGVRSGARGFDYTVSVENNARDFRLRALVPTGVEGDYFAHQTFAVLTRPSGRIWGDTTAGWKEAEPLEKNFSGFVGKRDADGNGLAVIAPTGLHEVAAWDDGEGTLAFTLLRAFRRTVMTNGETGGQMIGTHMFKMGIHPLGRITRYADLHRDYLFRSTDMLHRTIPVSHRSIREQTPAMILDGGDIVYSTYTAEDRSGGTAIVRLCNYSDDEATATMKVRDAVDKIEAVDFLGNATDQYSATIAGQHDVTVTVGSWKIATYRLTFKE